MAYEWRLKLLGWSFTLFACEQTLFIPRIHFQDFWLCLSMVPSGYEGITTTACLRIIDFSIRQYVKQVGPYLLSMMESRPTSV
jgi:hypothetical protein